jgi:CRISPR-associated protein Cmr6
MQFSNKGNNGWLFQKAYYHGFDWNSKTNEKVAPPFFKERLDWLKSTDLIPVQNSAAANKIKLYTSYPGLVTGTGVNHESKSKGELTLGFEFDYSIGMPVIRGHSVKGAIRSVFPQDHNRKVKHQVEKAYQIHCWIHGEEANMDGFTAFKQNKNEYEAIVAIENEIFDGKTAKGLLSAYDQDVFFDAYIVEASQYTSTMQEYLGDDSITPHGKNPLKNPIPIPFLKVISGVAFEFRFLLHDNKLLTIEQKLNLFKKILIHKGIGAKTNVGYGQLVTTNASSKSIPKVIEKNQIKDHTRYKESMEIDAKISEVTDDSVRIEVNGDILFKSKANILKKFNEMAEKRTVKGKSGDFVELTKDLSIKIRVNANFTLDVQNFTVLPIWK